jgi:hypothetical protein
VRQPTRVLRVIWSFASLKKVPLSAYSLAALEEANNSSSVTSPRIPSVVEGVEKKEEDCFVLFANALIQDARKSRSIIEFKENKKRSAEFAARVRERRREKAAKKMEKMLRWNERNRFIPKELYSSALLDGGKARKGSGAFGKGTDESGSESEEDEEEGDETSAGGDDKDVDQMDHSQLSFDFNSRDVVVDERTGHLLVTLTVRLASGAFHVGRASDKKLSTQKQRDVRELARSGTIVQRKPKFSVAMSGYSRLDMARLCNSKTSDCWQQRECDPILQILGVAFPQRWGCDESSPVVSFSTSFFQLVAVVVKRVSLLCSSRLLTKPQLLHMCPGSAQTTTLPLFRHRKNRNST